MLKYLKKNNLKIGILGGSFDPPHKGHLAISKVAFKKFKFNYILWTITKKNPSKNNPDLKLKTRIKLSKKILKNIKKIRVEYLDDHIKSSSTFDLLNFLKNFNKKLEIYFLIGADNLINFHKWHNWKKIPRIAKIIIFDRYPYLTQALNSVALKKLEKKDWIFVKFKKVNISSSKIKRI